MDKNVLGRHLLPLLICLLLHPLPGLSQDEEPRGLRLKSFTRAAHGRLLPGGWLVLSATVSNSGDQAATARLLATVGGVADVQSARSLTLPPQTEETFDVYVQVPKSLRGRTAAEVELALYRADEGGEVLLDLGGVPMRSSLRMQVEQSGNLTFTSLNDEPPELMYWQWPPKEAYHNYEIVVASRVLAGNSRNTVSFDHLPVPLNRMDWRDVGLMVVSETSFFEDATSVAALSQFINEGGRAWIMLDRIPCELVQPLLGHGKSCEELDQIELNSFSVKVAEVKQNFSAVDLAVDRDDPVVFKRVVQVGGTTSHTIDDWPAAIWMKVGYGEVLLTTLASAAWLRSGSESEDPQQSTNYRMTAWGLPLSLEVHEARGEPPVSATMPYPLELVGNPVLPRGLVGLILLSFIGLLVAAGAVCLRLGDLSKLGFHAPLLSILAGGGLLIGSLWIRRDIPETLSRLQVIQVGEDGRSASIREQSAVHLNSERNMSLLGEVDGYAIADDSIQSGIKRFDAGDTPQWRLSNIAWPPGSWRYHSRRVVGTEPLVATGRLTADGLRIDLPDSLGSFEDPVIGYAPGVPMIGELHGRRITADGSLMAAGDRWIGGTLISDEQRRRIAVYQQFFNGDERQLPPRSTLFGWMAPWDGASWSREDLTPVGSALVGLPLRLLRPPVGETILIPPGLVQLRKDRGEMSRTSAFNDRTGTWSPNMTLAIQANLQLVLPPEVLPLRADSLRLELAVKAPHRVVRLSSLASTGGIESAGEPLEIVQLDGPSVPWSGVVTEPSILADALDGVLELLLEIGERTDVQTGQSPSSVVTWQLDSFRASATGARLSEAEQRLTP